MALSGEAYVSIAWACCFITLLFVLLRLFLRYNRRSGGLGLSDWLVVIAWLNFIFQTSIDTFTLTKGLYSGKIQPHAEAYGPEHGLATYEDTILVLKLEYVEISFYYTEMYFVKWAMITFYYELFPKSRPKLRMALHVTLVLSIIGWFSSVSYKLFGCLPLKINWTPGPDFCETKNQVNSNAYEWAWHVFTDILIYILPLFLLKNLTLPRQQKIGVGLTFAVGFICIVFANLFQLSILLGQPLVVSWLLSALEQTWSLIVVCCPTFRVLMTRDWRSIWRGRRGRDGQTVKDTESSGYGGTTDGTHSDHKDRISKVPKGSENWKGFGVWRNRSSVGGGAGTPDNEFDDEESQIVMDPIKKPHVIYESKEVTYRVDNVDANGDSSSTNNLQTGLTTTVESGTKPQQFV